MTGRIDLADAAAFPADMTTADFWTSLKDHPCVMWGVVPMHLAGRVSGVVYLATPYTKVAAPDGQFNLIAARRVADSAVLRARQLAELRVCAVSPIVLAQAMVEDMKASRGTKFAVGWALNLVIKRIAASRA